MNAVATVAPPAPLTPASLATPKLRPLRWFIAAPARMALDPGLSHAAFRLALILLHYESADRGCYPSQETLAAHMGCSLDTVQRYTTELERYGFLTREKRRGNSAHPRNHYKLEPAYEPPVPHNSIESTGELEQQNAPRRRPPSPRTLRSHRDAEVTAPVRLLSGSEAPGIAAPVRPEVAAPGPKTEPHGCGTIKIQLINNQKQQDAAAALVGSIEHRHAIEAGLVDEGFVHEDAIRWASELGDLEAADVIAAACIMRTKHAYRNGKVRSAPAYIRRLVCAQVALTHRPPLMIDPENLDDAMLAKPVTLTGANAALAAEFAAEGIP
jgi:hypothetical protein